MNDNPRPYILEETNYKQVKAEDYQLAILPWGATEAHNYHLPYGTDSILASAVASNTAEYAWGKGNKCIVLPTIGFGVNTGQMNVPLCMNMNPSTQLAVLRDTLEVLDFNGIDKLVIINAHGGNHFKQFIRELSVEYPDIFVCSIDWWKAAPSQEYFDEPGDHAGELETSVIMHLRPELVLPLKDAGDGKAKKFKFEAFEKGWATAQREWTEVTEDTGVGDPRFSTQEKGEAFFNATCAEIGKFITELASTPNNELYE